MALAFLRRHRRWFFVFLWVVILAFVILYIPNLDPATRLADTTVARAKANADDHPATGFAGLTHRFDLIKPVIAAVNGLALGGGVEIIAACDLANAADHVRPGLPEPRAGPGRGLACRGLGPGGISRQRRRTTAARRGRTVIAE